MGFEEVEVAVRAQSHAGVDLEDRAHGRVPDRDKLEGHSRTRCFAARKYSSKPGRAATVALDPPTSKPSAAASRRAMVKANEALFSRDAGAVGGKVAGRFGDVFAYRFRLPFGFRRFAHRSTSGRFQTRVARRRAIGSGKSGSPVKRIAFRRVVRRTSATSARPRRFLPPAAIPSKMVSQNECPRAAETAGGVAPEIEPPARLAGYRRDPRPLARPFGASTRGGI